MAGIAHVDIKKTDEKRQKKYYEINTDLAVEACKKAKAEGVKQFIFMSSAIIYGESAQTGKQKKISKETIPCPAGHYGNSKWLADQGVRELADDSFTVSVIRSPMVYGKGCKGNYQTLSLISRKMIVFPDVNNERSMLYIDNLCEFLCQIAIKGEGGVFWPQNKNCVSTSDLVREIAAARGHKILVNKVFNWIPAMASLVPGKMKKLSQKAFGSLSYDMTISDYDFEYRVVDFKTSIERTEGK